MQRLTTKQEKYIQGLVSGLSQRKAYREAFPNSMKWKDTTVDSKASVLLKSDKVMERYQELITEYKQKTMWTRERAEEELAWLMQKAKEDLEAQGFRQANSTAFLNAIKELNEIGVVYPMREKQIAKMDNDMKQDTTTEDKVSELLNAIVSEVHDIE